MHHPSIQEIAHCHQMIPIARSQEYQSTMLLLATTTIRHDDDPLTLVSGFHFRISAKINVTRSCHSSALAFCNLNVFSLVSLVACHKREILTSQMHWDSSQERITALFAQLCQQHVSSNSPKDHVQHQLP